MKYIAPICILLLSFTCTSQSTALEDLLLKAYQSKDSSEIYFRTARKLIKSKADTANYYYFKHYKVFSSNKDSAAIYANRAIRSFIELDTVERLRKLYNQVHYLHLDKGNYEGALEYSQKALKTAEKQKDTAMISLHLSDMSNVYHDFEDYEKGVRYGKMAFSIANKAQKKEYKYLIFANNVIGINFDDWKKPDSALAYHYKNLKYLQKVDDSLRYSFVYNNIGNTLLKQQKFSEAKKYQLRALNMDKLKNNNYFLASDYNNLATIAYNENQNQLAEEYFKEAEKYALLSESIEKIRDVTQQRAWFYKKTGNYKKALELQEQFYVLRDSVFNTERAGKVAEMETKYETEKKEKELAQAKSQIVEKELQVERKNTIIYGVMALAIILSLLGYFLYSQQKLRNKQLQKESELKTALAKIETQNELQEQRLRISRDLHDNIGSQLTFIISSIDNLKFGLEGAANSVTDKLGKISDFTSQTIYELRDTIWAMNKTDISIEDLQARISNFIEKARVASDIQFQFYVDKSLLKETHFNSVQGMNIYRIIQESVNNALKYAEPKNIELSIEKEALPLEGARGDVRKYKIKIYDDGKGFDLKNTTFGNGIANIKKRTKDLGGKVEIFSENGKGTTVALVF